MSLVTSIARFARSPQGRQLTRQALRMAKDPKTRRQIADARTKLAKRGSGRRA